MWFVTLLRCKAEKFPVAMVEKFVTEITSYPQPIGPRLKFDNGYPKIVLYVPKLVGRLLALNASLIKKVGKRCTEVNPLEVNSP